MNSNVLIIGAGKINEVKSTLEEASISGKILYVSDPYVDTIYGGIIRPPDGSSLTDHRAKSRK